MTRWRSRVRVPSCPRNTSVDGVSTARRGIDRPAQHRVQTSTRGRDHHHERPTPMPHSALTTHPAPRRRSLGTRRADRRDARLLAGQERQVTDQRHVDAASASPTGSTPRPARRDDGASAGPGSPSAPPPARPPPPASRTGRELTAFYAACEAPLHRPARRAPLTDGRRPPAVGAAVDRHPRRHRRRGRRRHAPPSTAAAPSGCATPSPCR